MGSFRLWDVLVITMLSKITTTFVVLSITGFIQSSYSSSSSSSSTSSYTYQQHRDDAYYPAGTYNPLVQSQKMYWRDAINVLEDLSLFESLAVKFESCVWSPASSSSSSNNNNNNNNNNDGDTWYMGMVPPEEANVAFSLYGKLKTNSTRYRKVGKSPRICNSQHYINSFYTNSGFQVFLQSLATANIQRFDKYSYLNDYNNNYYSGYTAACSGGYTVSCTDNGNFAVYKYGISSLASESTCHGSARSRQVDNLQQLNSDINAGAKCVEIYNDIVQGPYVDTSDASGTAISLLTFSSACTLNDPIGKCPDPYGQLRVNERAYQRAATLRDTGLEYRIRILKSICVLLLGVAFLYAAYQIYLKEGDFVEYDKMTFQQFFRGSSPRRGLSDNNNNDGDEDNQGSKTKKSPRISTSSKKYSRADPSSPKSSRGSRGGGSSPSRGSFSPRRSKKPDNADDSDGFENPYEAMEGGEPKLVDADDYEGEEECGDNNYDDDYEDDEEDDDESDEFARATGVKSFAQRRAEKSWSVFEKTLRKLANRTKGRKEKKSRDKKDGKAEPLLVTDNEFDGTEQRHPVSEIQLVDTKVAHMRDMDGSNNNHRNRSRKNTQDSSSSKENGVKGVNRKSVMKRIGKWMRQNSKQQMDDDDIQRDDNDVNEGKKNESRGTNIATNANDEGGTYDPPNESDFGKLAASHTEEYETIQRASDNRSDFVITSATDEKVVSTVPSERLDHVIPVTSSNVWMNIESPTGRASMDEDSPAFKKLESKIATETEVQPPISTVDSLNNKTIHGNVEVQTDDANVVIISSKAPTNVISPSNASIQGSTFHGAVELEINGEEIKTNIISPRKNTGTLSESNHLPNTSQLEVVDETTVDNKNIGEETTIRSAESVAEEVPHVDSAPSMVSVAGSFQESVTSSQSFRGSTRISTTSQGTISKSSGSRKKLNSSGDMSAKSSQNNDRGSFDDRSVASSKQSYPYVLSAAPSLESLPEPETGGDMERPPVSTASIFRADSIGLPPRVPVTQSKILLTRSESFVSPNEAVHSKQSVIESDFKTNYIQRTESIKDPIETAKPTKLGKTLSGLRNIFHLARSDTREIQAKETVDEDIIQVPSNVNATTTTSSPDTEQTNETDDVDDINPMISEINELLSEIASTLDNVGPPKPSDKEVLASRSAVSEGTKNSSPSFALDEVPSVDKTDSEEEVELSTDLDEASVKKFFRGLELVKVSSTIAAELSKASSEGKSAHLNDTIVRSDSSVASSHFKGLAIAKASLRAAEAAQIEKAIRKTDSAMNVPSTHLPIIPNDLLDGTKDQCETDIQLNISSNVSGSEDPWSNSSANEKRSDPIESTQDHDERVVESELSPTEKTDTVSDFVLDAASINVASSFFSRKNSFFGASNTSMSGDETSLRDTKGIFSFPSSMYPLKTVSEEVDTRDEQGDVAIIDESREKTVAETFFRQSVPPQQEEMPPPPNILQTSTTEFLKSAFALLPTMSLPGRFEETPKQSSSPRKDSNEPNDADSCGRTTFSTPGRIFKTEATTLSSPRKVNKMQKDDETCARTTFSSPGGLGRMQATINNNSSNPVAPSTNKTDETRETIVDPGDESDLSHAPPVREVRDRGSFDMMSTISNEYSYLDDDEETFRSRLTGKTAKVIEGIEETSTAFKAKTSPLATHIDQKEDTSGSMVPGASREASKQQIDHQSRPPLYTKPLKGKSIFNKLGFGFRKQS